MPLPLFKLTHEVIHRLDYLFYHLFASILSICLYTTKNIQTNGTNHTINKMIKSKKNTKWDVARVHNIHLTFQRPTRTKTYKLFFQLNYSSHFVHLNFAFPFARNCFQMSHASKSTNNVETMSWKIQEK